MSRGVFSILVAIFVLLLGGGALVLVVGLARGPRATHDGPVASAPPLPATPSPPPPIPPPPPLTFVSPESSARLEPAERALVALRDAIKKNDLAAAEKQCAALIKEIGPLTAEPHPRVRAVVSGARRTCDCDLQLAKLVQALDAIEKSPGTKLPACKRAIKLVDDLRAAHYQDDPSVESVLARFGAVCAT